MAAGRPPNETEARYVCALKKNLPPIDEVVSIVQQRGVFEWGTKKNFPEWFIEIRPGPGIIRAHLTVLRDRVESLDHHRIATTVPAGYHWDVRPPLVPKALRLPIDPQPGNVRDALQLLVARWRVIYENSPQLELPR